MEKSFPFPPKIPHFFPTLGKIVGILGKIAHKNKKSTPFTIHEEDAFNKSNQSYSNILSPKRELNSCLRLSGKLHPQNALSPMLVTLSGIIMLLKEEKAQHCPSPSKREG